MKLSVPSYQVPGTWLFNVEKLAKLSWIEGVELLFFSFDADARKLFEEERDRVAAFSGRFFFSLHLPDPLSSSDRDLVGMTASFVDLYVLHPFGRKSEIPEIRDWARLVESFCSDFGAGRFALEYTGKDRFAKSRVFLPDIGICADTGCLIRERLSPPDWISEHEDSIREVHLHAARGEKDHLPLSELDAWVPELARRAARSDWIVNLETFSLEDTRISRDLFRRQLS